MRVPGVTRSRSRPGGRPDGGYLQASPLLEGVESGHVAIFERASHRLEQLHPLSSQIEALRGDLDSVSFRIALARLHNLAAGLFALQILVAAPSPAPVGGPVTRRASPGM